MVKEGVMDNPKIDAVFGIHINAQTEIGKIVYKPGGFMASADWFSIKVKGKQTHGSQPWMGIDPIAAATQIYTGLQMIVARESELTKAPVVITIGKINGGVRENIIPEELTMSGTIRTLDSGDAKGRSRKDTPDSDQDRREHGRDGRGHDRYENACYLQHTRISSTRCCRRCRKRSVQRM